MRHWMAQNRESIQYLFRGDLCSAVDEYNLIYHVYKRQKYNMIFYKNKPVLYSQVVGIPIIFL